MSLAPSPASRALPDGQPPRWRNPRLAVGVLLVLGSVVLGAQLFAAADDSVAVWTVTVDVAAGQEITDAMVAPRRVRFADAEEADRYLSASSALPLPAVATRPIGAGELLPRGALGVVQRLVELPLTLDGGHVPSTVRTGSVVDVWWVPASDRSRSQKVLDGVPVLAVTDAPTPTTSSSVQVVVGLSPAQADLLPGLLRQLSQGDLVLVRRPVS